MKPVSTGIIGKSGKFYGCTKKNCAIIAQENCQDQPFVFVCESDLFIPVPKMSLAQKEALGFWIFRNNKGAKVVTPRGKIKEFWELR